MTVNVRILDSSEKLDRQKLNVLKLQSDAGSCCQWQPNRTWSSLRFIWDFYLVLACIKTYWRGVYIYVYVFAHQHTGALHNSHWFHGIQWRPKGTRILALYGSIHSKSVRTSLTGCRWNYSGLRQVDFTAVYCSCILFSELNFIF